METGVSTQKLRSVIKNVRALNTAAAPDGLMKKRIEEVGFYEEQGLKFVYEDFDVGQLYVGLAVLARDMHLYLAQYPRKDAALFDEIISVVNTEEHREHGDRAFPNYEGLGVDNLPRQLASAAALGEPIVTPLGDREIVHEWTFKPGKRLFVRFGAKFKKNICGKDGPYKQFKKKGLLEQANLPMAIATTILNVGFSPATFWYPLAVYMSILLVKTGLDFYCEPSDSQHTSRKTTKGRKVKRTRTQGN